MKHTSLILTLAMAFAGCTSSEVKDAAAHLSLTPPVKVVQADVYTDGGTLQIRLLDADDNEFVFFHEGYLLEGSVKGKERLFIRGREAPLGTKRELFIGGTAHTPDDELTRVEAGSQTDEALLLLLQTWRENTFFWWQVRRVREVRDTSTYDEADWTLKRALGMEKTLERRISQNASLPSP